jgi:acyl-CoA reductase-like NAD-dependent aldehyde dehydrogenase
MSETDADAPIPRAVPQDAQPAPAASPAASPTELLRLLADACRERDRAIEMAAMYKLALEQSRQAYRELAQGLDEVRKGLAENQALYRRYKMLDDAARCERDHSEPLQ